MSGSKGFGWGSKGGGGALATGILQLQGGVPLDTTLRNVADQAGTLSPLQLSTTLVNITTSLGIRTTSPESPIHATGGTSMSDGWVRTATLEAVFPVLAFKSSYTSNRWAGIGYDSTSGMYIWLNKTTNDVTTGNAPIKISNTGYFGVGNTNNPLAPIHVGDGTDNNSGQSQILVSRKVFNTVAGSAHAFSDSSALNRDGSIGYNSFDGRITITGTYNYDHFVSFQSLPTYGSSGTTTNAYGLFTGIVSNAGTITNYYGAYYGAPTGAGTITNTFAFASEASAGYGLVGSVSTINSSVQRLQVSGGINAVLPTSSAGLVTGDFYTTAGAVMQVL